MYEKFLLQLHNELQSRLDRTGIKLREKLEWVGQPRTYWPQADILLENERQNLAVVIEYDNDSDPGRSVIKYWPILDQLSKEEKIAFFLIEVWKQGKTYGPSYAEAAKFVGGKLQDLYPNFRYHLFVHKTEGASEVAIRVLQTIEKMLDDVEALRDAEEALQEYRKYGGRDIEEVFAEIEEARALQGRDGQ